MLQRYSMSFDGHLLERGFWLYVWRIVSPQGEFLYVGRTGDSSSPHAGSPFSRIGQHLDFRPYAKGNALGRRLAAAGVRPAECLFEMLAVGPIFPEQTTMEAHRPFRDRTAALEKALAEFLLKRNYQVLGTHHCAHMADEALFDQVRRLIDPEFPAILGAAAPHSLEPNRAP